MRTPIGVFLLLWFTTTIRSEYSPFLEPYTRDTTHNGFTLNLFRRDGNCGSGTSCEAMGQPGACCSEKGSCALDEASHVACCPENAKCTGTIGGGVVIGTATSTGASTAAQTTGSGGKKTVDNAYYPFPYAPTNYPNAALCTSSYSSCNQEFAKCTYSLESGDSGISVPGAVVGVTTQAAIPDASAAPICSSLSSEACRNLQLASCATYGTASATGGGTFVAANAASTGHARMYGVGMGVGVVLGFAGQGLA